MRSCAAAEKKLLIMRSNKRKYLEKTGFIGTDNEFQFCKYIEFSAFCQIDILFLRLKICRLL